jgi:acyl-CoA thioesterase-1
MAFPGKPLAAEPLKIVAFGDSLTAGYKLAMDEAFPVVLEKALRKDGFNVAFVNAGVSGDTAEDGLARFDWTFADGADGAIIELGANDMLRGLDIKRIEKTLDEILARLKQRKIPALLVGVRAMPNLGPDYAAAFDQMYMDLAHKYDVPLFPFILEGVMNNPPLQLADHMHPNRQGVEKIVENMLPTIESFIKSLPPKS